MTFCFCHLNDTIKSGIADNQTSHSFVYRKVREAGTYVGNEAAEGEELDAGEALGADHRNLKVLLWRKHGVIPNGVEDDVGDRVTRTVAVAGLEEPAVVARAQFMLRYAGNGLEV
jgi:ribulose-5-phosphate 4-epimerase/fuculose-1-phosphate aldolase